MRARAFGSHFCPVGHDEIVLRRIIDFRLHDRGERIADLSCLHSRHVRDQPAFRDRGWVLTEAGRAGRVRDGDRLPCGDRTEMPDGVHVSRSAGPFNEKTLPAALRGDYRVSDGTWARLSTGAETEMVDARRVPAERAMLGSVRVPFQIENGDRLHSHDQPDGK